MTAAGEYEIRLARPVDLPFLADIELAAARLLAGFAPESVLAEATPLREFETSQATGGLWVATVQDRPVGFAHMKALEEGSAHLDELDVHPTYGRRGLGRRLVTAVCEWAAEAGMHRVTLSTFREPRWNMPFYASLGFEALPPECWSDALRNVVADEVRRGLDPAGRVVMARRVV
jgi:GNAT superfamily N-acetyltransferase